MTKSKSLYTCSSATSTSIIDALPSHFAWVFHVSILQTLYICDTLYIIYTYRHNQLHIFNLIVILPHLFIGNAYHSTS